MSKTKKTSSLTVRKPAAASSNLTTEEIALRAYHIYLERGGAPGNALEDWTRAERELGKKPSKPGRKPAPKSLAA